MFDTTFNAKSIARSLKKTDFVKRNDLIDASEREKIIHLAVITGTSGFSSIALKSSILRGKPVYKLTNLAEILVLRHIASNIKRVTGVRQDDRRFIVTCMSKMLSEGTPFRVYKFDIASFYESVDPIQIINQLENDTAFSGQATRSLRSFFSQMRSLGISGLPRGVSLSATLAEYFMRNFDIRLSRTTGVWFYARFVDDIAIITNGKEDPLKFINFVTKTLPDCLSFNSKSAHWSFSLSNTKNSTVEHFLDYLGYRFFVSYAHRDRIIFGNKVGRLLWLDIAPSKVRKIKTRVARSMLAYHEDGDFSLLLSRIRLLTSNFTYLDVNSGSQRTSGIYFNYELICAERSVALPELDKFLLNAVTSRHPKNDLRPHLTAAQRQQILNLRFQDGFKTKRFFSFSSSRLATLTKCWAYA